MKSSGRVIIGLVGQPSGGKDTVADYLVDKYDFKHISTGDLVRQYIATHNLGEPTRPVMNQVSNDLRARNGSDYLARLALKDGARRLVVSGLRNPAEAQAIKAAGGQIVAVTATMRSRYERAVKRGRAGDNLTFAQFKAQQAAEDTSADSNSQNVAAVVAMADTIINNDGSLDELYQKTDELIQKAS